MSDTAAEAALAARVAAEMAVPTAPSPAMAGALALARDIVAEHGDAVRAVLFYGSCRRTGDASGLLDLYVVHDGQRAFHRHWLPALLNAALPPNVMQRVGHAKGVGEVRAKVAVLSRRQFERRLRAGTMDTTIWARFCQPTTLVHARDAEAAAWAATAGARAFATAALWAARLGPRQAAPAGFWQALFASTYGAELRTERRGRGNSIHEAAPEWFDGNLPLAFAAQGLDARPDAEGRLAPGLPPSRRWSAGWALRRWLGKPLNVARLVKAAFTFEGGADYLAWKIERHSGEALALTDWQRRHPVLAAPRLLWRLLRRGAVR
ncbi:hypothetical protein MHZ93_06470 [Roseomonas sp. ACRSG]|nr:hypothetical protein [Roseomonas sp. ACRSG]